MGRRHPDRLVKQGLAQERRGDRAGAEATYRSVLKRHPGHVGACAQLGGLLAQEGRLAEAVGYLEVSHAALGDLASTNNLCHALRELGRFQEALEIAEQAASPKGMALHYGRAACLHQLGRWIDSARAYRDVLAIEPSFQPAWMGLATVLERHEGVTAARLVLQECLVHGNLPGVRRRLGLLYAREDRLELAEAMLRGALQEQPDDPVALHMLNAVRGEQAEPPAGFVATFFDAFAEGYEAHLVEGLQTRVPALIAQHAPATLGRLLDLGCGTGLAARALQGRYDYALGVDLSPRMVAEARRTGLYDDVRMGHLTDVHGSYDWAVLADVLVYVADIEPVLEHLARHSRGVLLTVETGSGLQPTGRYQHDLPTVQEMAERHGFAVEVFESPLRREAGAWVQGALLRLSRG